MAGQCVGDAPVDFNPVVGSTVDLDWPDFGLVEQNVEDHAVGTRARCGDGGRGQNRPRSKHRNQDAESQKWRSTHPNILAEVPSLSTKQVARYYTDGPGIRKTS
jgi:hypothetical protein